MLVKLNKRHRGAQSLYGNGSRTKDRRLLRAAGPAHPPIGKSLPPKFLLKRLKDSKAYCARFPSALLSDSVAPGVRNSTGPSKTRALGVQNPNLGPKPERLGKEIIANHDRQRFS